MPLAMSSFFLCLSSVFYLMSMVAQISDLKSQPPCLLPLHNSVGDACYHIEEAEVDCDKTIHGHPCCVIRYLVSDNTSILFIKWQTYCENSSEECECVQERFHTQIFPPSLPPRCQIHQFSIPFNFIQVYDFDYIIPIQGVHGLQTSQGGLETPYYCCHSPSR